MSSRVFGYVRVSTANQCEDRQMIAMREYGVPEKNIVVEKRSGRDFDRPRYQKLLRRLKPGDTLVIKSLDRLGRDYLEVQEQWRVISKVKGASIIVLDTPLLNTKENAELIGQLITDLVLQLFSFVAQTERENIRARQREGIDAAKARGVRFGRPRLAMPENFQEVAEQWRRGEFNAQEAARRLGISRTTFFRRVRELERARHAEQSASQHAGVPEVRDSRVSSEPPHAAPKTAPASYSLRCRNGLRRIMDRPDRVKDRLPPPAAASEPYDAAGKGSSAK